MYKYTYTFKEVSKILTPFDIDLSDVKTDIVQSSDCIKTTAVYPNGFEFESFLYSDKIVFHSSKELVDNGDGTLSVVL
ncbi:hypothetical protein E1H24_02080 [Clostridioides difficile]|uniref:hypothetical protein n=1 Tax=Clostridioides difficile TaxID=1496 RepID=UPI0006BC0564|nr:hypothetical protein [Clostridioides difficile]EGT4823066.1 hypothetical protein [Clostridioides difficile]EGT5245307.1 hypothetical protein [Clostridioides difficile]EII6832795.1 hypothetical protein [Clostridioides difficile]EJA6610263.1 hypothetical protein [Clostridioides difficile]EKS6798219.1 hypothetical protein [Clostridioides difficile]